MVAGLYFLRNLTNEKITAFLFYPFPIDSFHSYPDTIFSDQPFTKADSGIRMKISFPPKATKTFYAYYEQKLKSKTARYIVKTTRQWQRPLDLARFEITLPKNGSNYKISYRADSIKEESSYQKIYFTRKNFFPKKDIIINW